MTLSKTLNWYTFSNVDIGFKVIEECPSQFVSSRPGMREKITKCAVTYASKLKYKSAGTVEFLVDDVTGQIIQARWRT